MVTTDEKTVLITGGNRGLGRALVQHFAAQPNWTVLATARKPETLPEECSRCQLDLGSSGIDALVNQLQQANNAKIDLLIHNAGFNAKDKKEVKDYFESTYYIKKFSAQNVAESCFTNALHPMELTGKLLERELLSEDCCIIGISTWLASISGKQMAGHYGYAGSKALFNMFLKSMALEFEKDPDSARTVIALNPGWMSTDMGGPNATSSPIEVALQIYDMVTEPGFCSAQNGKFLNADRSEHPW